jgi:hypothetical protein
MIPALEQLARRIRDELNDLDRAVLRVGRAWKATKAGAGEQDLYLDSVALNLHSFYSGLERLFELIARQVDGNLPSGPSWHEDLLRSMTEQVAGVRPAVVSGASAARLDEFRCFRHLVRNVYATNLVPERLSALVEGMPDVWPELRRELSGFADFLDDVASQREARFPPIL